MQSTVTPTPHDIQRGIRVTNTQSRFIERTQKRTTQSALSQKENFSKQKDFLGNTENQKLLAHLHKNGFSPTEKDMALHVHGGLVEEPFPVLIFIAAFLKDLFDLFLTFTIVGMLLIFPISFILSLFLAVWLFGKATGGSYKRWIIKSAWRRFFIMLGFESLPFFSIIPAHTIFVYLTYKREAVFVKNFNALLETIHKNKDLKRSFHNAHRSSIYNL